MANEITTVLRLNVANGNYTDQFLAAPAITQNTLGAASGVQTIGTSAENLAVGDVATLGMFAITNLDSTNYVTYGPDDSGTQKTFGRLSPGESAIMRLQPGITVKLTANTAPVKIKYLLLND